MSQSKRLKVTVLGCGTSTGVPVPGCQCDVCTSDDPKNNRLRCSLLLEYNGKNILIDAGPDLRAQVLRAKISHIDAILFTHAHADHILGIDDIRPFNFIQQRSIPCYGSKATLEQIKRMFFYVFDRDPMYRGGSVSNLALNEMTDFHEITIAGLSIIPFPLLHGNSIVYGFRIGKFAYATDCKKVPETSKEVLRNLEVLILDGLREEPHDTHLSISESVEVGRELEIKQLYLTHMSHSVDYKTVSATLPSGVALCYDGLSFEIEL